MSEESPPPRPAPRVVPEEIVERFNALSEGDPLEHRLTRSDLAGLINSYTGLLVAVRSQRQMIGAMARLDQAAMDAASVAFEDAMFKAFDEFYGALTNILGHETAAAET